MMSSWEVEAEKMNPARVVETEQLKNMSPRRAVECQSCRHGKVTIGEGSNSESDNAPSQDYVPPHLPATIDGRGIDTEQIVTIPAIITLSWKQKETFDLTDTVTTHARCLDNACFESDDLQVVNPVSTLSRQMTAVNEMNCKSDRCEISLNLQHTSSSSLGTGLQFRAEASDGVTYSRSDDDSASGKERARYSEMELFDLGKVEGSNGLPWTSRARPRVNSVEKKNHSDELNRRSKEIKEASKILCENLKVAAGDWDSELTAITIGYNDTVRSALDHMDQGLICYFSDTPPTFYNFRQWVRRELEHKRGWATKQICYLRFHYFLLRFHDPDHRERVLAAAPLFMNNIIVYTIACDPGFDVRTTELHKQFARLSQEPVHYKATLSRMGVTNGWRNRLQSPLRKVCSDM